MAVNRQVEEQFHTWPSPWLSTRQMRRAWWCSELIAMIDTRVQCACRGILAVDRLDDDLRLVIQMAASDARPIN